MYEDGSIPIDELRSDIYFKGIALRNEAQALLQQCRKFEMTFWKSLRRTEVRKFTFAYDELYQKYIKHDASVSSYAGMCSNPFERDEEGNQLRKDLNRVMLLNISAQGLTSQRQTIQVVLGDISSTINGLNSEANNRIVNAVAVLSLIVALVSLVVSLIAFFK
jgi:hypothetical protein